MFYWQDEQGNNYDFFTSTLPTSDLGSNVFTLTMLNSEIGTSIVDCTNQIANAMVQFGTTIVPWNVEEVKKEKKETETWFI